MNIEVSKMSEVATAEEKCELGTSSFEDPTKPSYNGIDHHNLAYDHQNSYIDVAEVDGLEDNLVTNKNIFVAGVDDPNDDLVTNKNVVAMVAGGLSVLPESNTTFDNQVNQVPEVDVDAHNDKLDIVNGEDSKQLSGEEENGNVEWVDDFPPLVSSNIVNGHGFQHNWKTKCWLNVFKNPQKTVMLNVSATSDVSITRKTEVCFDVKNDDAPPNITLEAKNVEGMGGQLDPATATATGCCTEKSFQLENEETGNHESEDIDDASPEGSIAVRTELIHEIKQLKQLHEELSTDLGSQDKIKQALKQREEVEERLNILKKELDIFKDRVLKAETAAAEAEKKYDDEKKKVKELQTQFRTAAEARQTAYAQWQILRTEFSDKRNMNDEFHRDYIRSNASSSTKSPDEEPTILPSYADEIVNKMASEPVKVDSVSQIPKPELKQKTSNEDVTLYGKPTKKVTEPKNQKVTRGPTTIVHANSFDALSGRELIDEVFVEPIRSRDELESLRKEEEMRKVEADDKLKEQQKLEAVAKANEAREREERQAEKLQRRAESKTQMEEERKEKEREKRLRKKQRKKEKAAVADAESKNCESAPSSESAVENSKDIQVKDKACVAPKKPQKPWQSKVPPPLRNRNKKRLQQWMWVGITSSIILVLFWLGNIGVFSKWRGPVH